MQKVIIYTYFDDNLERAKSDVTFKQILKENFCHSSYRNRLQYDDEKFKFYCNFFDLDYDYMKKNIQNYELNQ
jgi:hypothetical protein